MNQRVFEHVGEEEEKERMLELFNEINQKRLNKLSKVGRDINKGELNSIGLYSRILNDLKIGMGFTDGKKLTDTLNFAQLGVSKIGNSNGKKISEIKITESKRSGKVIAVIGDIKAGKTYLVQELAKEKVKEGDVVVVSEKLDEEDRNGYKDIGAIIWSEEKEKLKEVKNPLIIFEDIPVEPSNEVIDILRTCRHNGSDGNGSLDALIVGQTVNQIKGYMAFINSLVVLKSASFRGATFDTEIGEKEFYRKMKEKTGSLPKRYYILGNREKKAVNYPTPNDDIEAILKLLAKRDSAEDYDWRIGEFSDANDISERMSQLANKRWEMERKKGNNYLRDYYREAVNNGCNNPKEVEDYIKRNYPEREYCLTPSREKEIWKVKSEMKSGVASHTIPSDVGLVATE